jgi:hypothetical protein
MVLAHSVGSATWWAIVYSVGQFGATQCCHDVWDIRNTRSRGRHPHTRNRARVRNRGQAANMQLAQGMREPAHKQADAVSNHKVHKVRCYKVITTHDVTEFAANSHVPAVGGGRGRAEFKIKGPGSKLATRRRGELWVNSG